MAKTSYNLKCGIFVLKKHREKLQTQEKDFNLSVATLILTYYSSDIDFKSIIFFYNRKRFLESNALEYDESQTSRDDEATSQRRRLNPEPRVITEPRPKPVLPPREPGTDTEYSPPGYPGVTAPPFPGPEASAPPPDLSEDLPEEPPPAYSTLGFDK